MTNNSRFAFQLFCYVLTYMDMFNRVWFPFQDPTMSLGAKDWMDWLLDQLSIINKEPVLPSGEINIS